MHPTNRIEVYSNKTKITWAAGVASMYTLPKSSSNCFCGVFAT